MPSVDEARPPRLPAGPLAVEWQGSELTDLRAGTQHWAQVSFRNAGTVAWQPPDESERGIWLSFHWLDRLGNAMVWEGHRTPIPDPVKPGESITLTTPIRGAVPPGPYRLAFDLVDEGRCWFADVGNAPLEIDADVAPRLRARSLSVEIGAGPDELVRLTRAALERQDEAIAAEGNVVAHLAPGCMPRADWARRLLNAHDEGYAVVGGAIAPRGSALLHRRARRRLAPWVPGTGRKPNWQLPLLCPSLAADIHQPMPLAQSIVGLPAIDMTANPEPWLYDGRIVIDVPLRAVRQAGRRPA